MDTRPSPTQDLEDHELPEARLAAAHQPTRRCAHGARSDFERAFARLSQEEQTALASTYRDKLDQQATAFAVGCSVRKLFYLIPAARQHLADVLDRLDLL